MRRRWVRIANQRERNGGHPAWRIPKSCACGRRLAMLLSPFNRTLIRQRFARLFGIPSRSSRPVAIPCTVAYAVPESLLFGTALEKLAYRQKRKALGPPQHHFGTTAPPVARHGAVLSSPRQWKTLRAE